MRKRALTIVVMLAAMVAVAAAGAVAGTVRTAALTTTVLSQSNGDSEPAISIGSDGTMAITGLPWIRPTLADFSTRLWTGSFGSTPTLQGGLDGSLIQPGRVVVGALDADVDIGSTGRLHATSLLGLVNPPFTAATIGVSAVTCPSPASAGFSIANCTAQIIDKAGADRQWITSDGQRVWISYHDSVASSLIHVQRSNDDGFTWRKVGDPIPGQGRATGDATFNNTAGPIVADPFTHNVYVVYAAGEPSVQKGTSADFNNIYVSRSTDGVRTWTAKRVFRAPLFTRLNNIFPALGVDPSNGALYAAWSDTDSIFVSKSTDQGMTWSPAQAVSSAPVNTALMPWVAAKAGVVDVVFYGTSATSKDDPGAVWNVYLAKSTNGGISYSQSLVSPTSNHVGPVCTNGSACPADRELLDLFEVAIAPSGKAGIIYTDTTLTTTSTGAKLPQIVLAQES